MATFSSANFLVSHTIVEKLRKMNHDSYSWEAQVLDIVQGARLEGLCHQRRKLR